MELTYLNIMLYVTGIFTIFPGILYFFPIQGPKRLLKIEPSDELSLMFVQHWGFLVSTLGVLIVYSVHAPEVRNTILIAATVEKAAFVFLIIKNWQKDFAKGMRSAAVFDAICVVLYILVVLNIT